MLKNLLFTLLAGVFLSSNIYAKSEVDDYLQKVQTEVNSINTEQFLKILKETPNIKVIDVRAKSDILAQGGYIKANKILNIPRGKLEFMIGTEVKKEEKFVVYCGAGNISLLAAKQLKDLGYKNVIHYKDSYNGWSKAGLETRSLDRYPESLLFSKVEKVADGVYTSIGQTSPGRYENSGHNNNLGFVVGNDSVLVWNASSSYLLAKALHEEIKKITDKPVKYVVLENSQGHAMLGSNYWKEQGAHIVAQEIAKQEIIDLGQSIHKRYGKTQKDKFLGTKVVLPDEVFKDKRVFDLGGRTVEALYFGYAHEHSDICIWLPKEKIVFAGDLAFNQRMLPIFEITETTKWLEAWDQFAALDAKIVVPGHGEVTDMATVTKYTKDYLVYLRTQIAKIIENDGGLNDAYNMDLSQFEHFDTFKELAKQNIARLFKQMEFE